MGQAKMDNPEKLATQGTQDEENQNENTTQHVLDTTIRKQTQVTHIRHEPSHKRRTQHRFHAEIATDLTNSNLSYYDHFIDKYLIFNIYENVMLVLCFFL